MMNLLQRLWMRPTLVPLNWGAPDCPTLAVGDRVVGVLQEEAVDYIALSCGTSGTMKAGMQVTYRVLKTYEDGEVLLERKGKRALLKYLKWNGNVVTISANFCHSEMKIGYYKRVLVPRW